MKADWDTRIRRANELTSVYPSAAEALAFYARVAALQRTLHAEYGSGPAHSSNESSTRSLRDELDMAALLPKFPQFLLALEAIAPPPLAQVAAELAQNGAGAWVRAIEDFWRESRLRPPNGTPADSDENGTLLAERCLAWLFLQPFAELLSSRQPGVAVVGTLLNCPLCEAKPLLAILRPEGDGARKSLLCMLCGHEWTFRRLCCPACGEEREPRIAFYTAPEIPNVRVDVCDTCHFYMKSIDLTRTGLAVPIVDELASLSLDLWAREKGYKKLQLNMLGV